MKKVFVAKVEWISFENGGREKIPSQNTKYSPIIRVNGTVLNKESWSVVFICNETINGNIMIVEMKFLSPNAPEDILKNGMNFELFEGNKKIAIGNILLT